MTKSECHYKNALCTGNLMVCWVRYSHELAVFSPEGMAGTGQAWWDIMLSYGWYTTVQNGYYRIVQMCERHTRLVHHGFSSGSLEYIRLPSKLPDHIGPYREPT